MVQQGVHPTVVQERLSPADIGRGLNSNPHLLPAIQQEAAEELEMLLAPIDVSKRMKRIGEPTSNSIFHSGRWVAG